MGVCLPVATAGPSRWRWDAVRSVPFLEPYGDQVVVELIAQAAVKKRVQDGHLCVNDGQFVPVCVSGSLQFGHLFPHHDDGC